jgi:pantoate--beta-alanine ligase
LPSKPSLYPDDYRYRVQESKASTVLEGEHRPGHFDGVLTVVLKLFQLVSPQRAYFGEKDWQQLQLVKGMTDAFFLPLEIISCPTVRDERGLALSSRNSRLSGDGRVHAANFVKILRSSATAAEASAALTQSGFSVEYVEDVVGRRLAAIVYEGVRLIDNIAL